MFVVTPVALFVCLGLYIILNSTLGIVGGFKRSPILLKICFVMGLLSLVFQGLACAGLFWNTESAGNLVDTLSDDELARFTEGLGMRGMSKAELKVRWLASSCRRRVALTTAPGCASHNVTRND